MYINTINTVHNDEMFPKIWTIMFCDFIKIQLLILWLAIFHRRFRPPEIYSSRASYRRLLTRYSSRASYRRLLTRINYIFIKHTSNGFGYVNSILYYVSYGEVQSIHPSVRRSVHSTSEAPERISIKYVISGSH
jgi:hypothetical protein